MNKRLACFIATFMFSSVPFTMAEDIKILVGDQSPELQTIDRPTTGMLKTAVKSKYGQPIKEVAAKGKPPISSWEYADFVVYFENDHVIHSVLKPKYHESKTTVIEQTDEMSEDDLKTQ